jgi:drug/metabolite transporter (DMT)-like permease
MVSWVWIPITIAAAFAQTIRNATQRSLTGDLGMLGATLVRFLYGLPFAALWLVVVSAFFDFVLPAPTLEFVLWTAVGALAQIAATAFLLQVMAMRNFAVGSAYSKTEVVQVAVFGFLILGEAVSLPVSVSIVLAASGVMLLSAPAQFLSPRAWVSPAALLGIASGGAFAISAVGYRAAALALAPAAPALAAACALVLAQALQSVVLGGYLLLRAPAVVTAVFTTWRVSMVAGLMGALASMGWFTAMAIEPVAHVRTLGLIELVFSYAVSRRFFRERLSPPELVGMALLALGLIGVTLSR